jgi:hypothetical protein
MSYTYDVQPARMAERVISAAEQIACEWRDDLALMSAEAEGVWRKRRAVTLEDNVELRQTLYRRTEPTRGASHGCVPHGPRTALTFASHPCKAGLPKRPGEQPGLGVPRRLIRTPRRPRNAPGRAERPPVDRRATERLGGARAARRAH